MNCLKMINRLTLLVMLISSCSPKIVAAVPTAKLLEQMKVSSIKAGPMLPLTKEKFELLTFASEYLGNNESKEQRRDFVCSD